MCFQEGNKTENTNRVDMAVKSCVICNKIYMATEHLNHHMVVHHGLGLAKGDSTGLQNEAQRQTAGEDGKEQSDLKRQDTGQTVKCKYCGEVLQEDQALEHFFSAHPGEKVEYEKETSVTT